MFFTFSEEPSYGTDTTSQEFTVDLVYDEVITNVNYEKVREFNYPTSKSRRKTIKTGTGRVGLDLTYGNEGWESLYKCLLGQSKTLTDYSLAKTSEAWNVVTGMLSADLDSSDTSFTISEYKEGEFNGVDGIIIGNEFIAITIINNGVISVSSRASEGTVATSHDINTLCYGVVIETDSYIKIISRYRSGFCYSLPTSLTTMIYREGDYFSFNGTLFSDYVFNAGKNEISSSFEIHSKNTRIINLSNPSTTVDGNQLVSPNDIKCYSMGEHFNIQKLYLQISNSLSFGPSTFFDTSPEKLLLNSHSAYGQFTISDESIVSWNQYIDDDELNLSISLCESRQFEKAYVFSFNKIRYGTLIRVLYTKIDMLGDSVPFYSYDPDAFTILIQGTV